MLKQDIVCAFLACLVVATQVVSGVTGLVGNVIHHVPFPVPHLAQALPSSARVMTRSTKMLKQDIACAFLASLVADTRVNHARCPVPRLAHALLIAVRVMTQSTFKQDIPCTII
jgi:hypothetical protein